MSLAVILSFWVHGIVMVLFLVNAIPWLWQGPFLYSAGVTLSTCVLLWTFIRRIASLLGEHPGEDWDPKRG